MQRFALPAASFVLVSVLLTGCQSGSKKDDQAGDKKKASQQQQNESTGKKPKENGKGKGAGEQTGSNAAVAKELVGTWTAGFVVDDAAFQQFVEANMLPDDLAETEKARWNESSISIVFNSDGTCVFTEPDGNFFNANWKVSNSNANRHTVLILGSDATKTASIELNAQGFECDFVDDQQFNALPIKKPLVFTRD